MTQSHQVQFWSFFDVIFWSIMVGIGESYMSAFALSYGFSERFSGLVIVIPLGLASVAQVFAPKILSIFKTQKHSVVFCAFMQALTLFALLIQPAIKKGSNEGLIIILTMYWFFALSAGPPWNSWIVSLIPRGSLKEFFAKRGVIHQLALVMALAAGGLMLSRSNGSPETFKLLFLIAGVARLISTLGLLKHPIGEREESYTSSLDLNGFYSWIKSKDVLGIILFIAVFRFGVSIAAPFFTPFVLKKLEIGYEAYMIAILAPFFSRALSYRYSSQTLNFLGIQKSLVIHLSLIAVLPLFWSFEPSLGLLIFAQLLSGVGWGGFEYALLFRQIEDFQREERSRVLTWTNFIIGISTIAGVILGSELIGKSPTVDSYKLNFYLSSALRISPLFFIFLIDWKSTRHSTKRYFFRVVGIRINKGAEVRPVLYTDDNESH